MTRDEFIENYTNGSNPLYWSMNERGRFAIPCECDLGGCDGWQMAYASEVDRYIAQAIKNARDKQ